MLESLKTGDCGCGDGGEGVKGWGMRAANRWLVVSPQNLAGYYFAISFSLPIG